MSTLNDILDTLDMKGVLYFRTDLSSPWAVTVPELEQAARFHLVVQGSCLVTFQSGNVAQLNPGDLILIPAGQSHVLSCQPVDQAPMLETVLADVGYKGDGVLVVGGGDPKASTQLVCGHFNFRRDADHPILRAMPEFIHTSGSDRAQNILLDEVLRLIVRTVMSDKIGSAATVTRLSEIVFIELVQTGIGDNSELASILEAFKDDQIGRALDLIHKNTDTSWTVGTLASEVGMSRSRFAERFSDLLGMGPMSYVSDWRLQKALALLEESRASVQQISAKAGYRSPSAFTRAFSDKFGKSPSEHRRLSH